MYDSFIISICWRRRSNGYMTGSDICCHNVLIWILTNNNVRSFFFPFVYASSVMYSKIKMPKKSVDYITSLVFFIRWWWFFTLVVSSFFNIRCACVEDEEHVRKQEKRASKKVICKSIYIYISWNNNNYRSRQVNESENERKERKEKEIL